MKVGIYCRLSEEDRDKKNKEDESESIQNQKSMLISYAMQHDWEVFHIYSDDDFTGADRDRPGWKQLLKDAENHKFDIVLCKSQSRFTRELEMVEKYIHGLFQVWDIRFVSVIDNADTHIKGNKKARQINGLINEWYLEDLSENIKSVFTDKRKKGFHIGAFALYGYIKDPEQKGHLIIDEESAEIVREVFKLFAQGYGKTNIARLLNDREIPNPTEYKRLKGLRYKQPPSKQSTLWKYFSISDMLTNEIYRGHMVQGKYGSISYKTKQNKPIDKKKWIKVENTHEPIIDEDLWNTVQNLLKQKSKSFSNGEIGAFAGKVKCLYCGYTLRSGKRHEQRYFRCETKFFSKDACIGSGISYPVLERTVLAELKKLSMEYLDKDYIEGKVSFDNRIEEQRNKLEKDIDNFQNKITVCSNGVKNLYIDKTKGLITDDEFIDLSKDFHSDKEKYKTLIEDAKIKIADLDEKLSQATSKRELIEQYTNIESLDRETVTTLIDYIEIGKWYKGTRKRPINIYWNF